MPSDRRRKALRQRRGRRSPETRQLRCGRLSRQARSWKRPEPNCSLADVYATRAGLDRPPLATVALNALLVGDRDAVLDQARQAAAEGYRAAKLKVGGLAPDEAGALARDVAQALGDTALRVDANRAWSLDGALAFARALGDVPVEYVEEPLADLADLPALSRQTEVRWALDESLWRAAQEPAISSDLSVAVVKPMLDAGLVWWAATERSGRFDRRPSLTSVVVSSVFESGAGMRHLVALAAALGDDAAGLDTYRWLASDLLDRPLLIGGPTVDVGAVLAPNPVRMEYLTPVGLP